MAIGRPSARARGVVLGRSTTMCAEDAGRRRSELTKRMTTLLLVLLAAL